MKNTGSDSVRDADWCRVRTDYLAGFMTPDRAEVIRRVAGDRTRWMTVCMENVFHPHNASALIRHCDAFGIQDIHTVETLCKFSPSTDVVKGTDKWVTFRRHKSSTAAITALRDRGYRIIATTPHLGDVRPEEFDVTAGPFALVFGTELEGVSPEMIAEADGFIRIPMCGFVESLNVSAAAAIILHALSSRLRTSGVEWQLPSDDRDRLLFEWMSRAVRGSKKILERFPG